MQAFSGINFYREILSLPVLALPSISAVRQGLSVDDDDVGIAMKSVARLAIAGVMSAGIAGPSFAAPLNTMNEVRAAIQACWTPPADAGNASVTLSFSFKRDGTLIGPPRPTAIKVDGDAKAKKSFVDAATTALQNCLPLSFSPTLAQGMAGNVFTLQFTSPKK